MDKQSETVLRGCYCSLGPKHCAEMLGISYRACVIRAWKLGVGSRRKARRDEIVGYVREWYPKTTAQECAKALGITAQHVRSLASEMGVVGRREKTRYSRSVNAKFFDTWTKESAYVLGFIYADGSIRRDRVSLYQNEIDFLEVLRLVMGIKTAVRHHMARCHVVSFNCCYLADRLRAIGIRERKSFGNMVFPMGLPDDLYSHFFRGFFDGDGSVGVYGQWDNLRVSLWGQRDFIKRMYVDTNRIVGACGGGTRRGTSKRNDFFTCSWGAKKDVELIYRWMYDDCGDLLLPRKKAVFDEWVATHGNDGDLRLGRKWAA